MLSVSVIMPTYNRGSVISGAIRSVLEQTYTNWELIIVDDGSQDNTVQKIHEWQDDRIRLIHYDENQGANHARNIGLEQAKGDVAAFLDSDNAWDQTYLERQVCLFENSFKKPDVVFARTKTFGRAATIFPEVAAQEIDSEEKMIRRCLRWSIFDTNVTAMRRSVYEKQGGFDEAMARFQDWDYFLSLLVTGKYRFVFLDEVLCTNGVREDSITMRSDLYWDARLTIFEKNLEICRKRGMMEEVLEDMLQKSGGSLFQYRHYRKLGALLKKEEQDMVFAFHYRYNRKQIDLVRKNNRIIGVQNEWMKALCKGRRMEDYFHENGIKVIAIYGFGILGQSLWQELVGSDIRVELVIDRQKKSEEIAVYKLEEIERLDVEMVVVTVISENEDIENKMKGKFGCRAISIVEIVSSIAAGCG